MHSYKESSDFLSTSIYNLYIPSKIPEGYIIFNTFTGTILNIDDELKKALDHNLISGIPDNIKTMLLDQGIIVKNGVDERKIFDVKYTNTNYNNKSAQFSIIPTYKCNLACPYCYEGSGTIFSKTMDEEIAGRVLKAIKSYTLKQQCTHLGVTLYGGEPLVVKNLSLKILSDLNEWAKQNDIKFSSSMITNATLTDEKTANDFAPYLQMVQCTLDGPKTFHDSRRVQKNGKGTYEKIIRAIKLWRKENIPVSLRIQISADTYDNIELLFSDLAKEGFNQDPGIFTYVFPLMELNNICASMASLYVKDDDELKVLPTVWRKALKFGFKSVVAKPVQTFISPYCSFTKKNYFLIDGFGDLYKCVSVVGDRDFKVAEISNSGNITNFTPEFYNFQTRDPLQIHQCKDCVYLPMCSGGCANRAFMKDGTYNSPDCTLHKGLLEERIKLYLNESRNYQF